MGPGTSAGVGCRQAADSNMRAASLHAPTRLENAKCLLSDLGSQTAGLRRRMLSLSDEYVIKQTQNKCTQPPQTPEQEHV